jgi:CheY-like chemotaxis protein
MNLEQNRNRRILVVDDNKAIHDDFRKILSPDEATRAALNITETVLFGNPVNEERQTQFEIDSAYQGDEGVNRVKEALAKKRPYAMAFVDMRMPPGWDGIKTAQNILEIDPEIQIVICTAYSEYSWKEMLDLMGNGERVAILKKPFDTVEALRLTNERTEKWRVIHGGLKKSATVPANRERGTDPC